jgi:hypothetical protein
MSTFYPALSLTQLSKLFYWSCYKSRTSIQLSALVNVGYPTGAHENNAWDHQRERWQTGSGYITKSGNRPTRALKVRISLQQWIYVRIIPLCVSLRRHSPCHGQISRPTVHKKSLKNSQIRSQFWSEEAMKDGGTNPMKQNTYWKTLFLS